MLSEPILLFVVLYKINYYYYYLSILFSFFCSISDSSPPWEPPCQVCPSPHSITSLMLQWTPPHRRCVVGHQRQRGSPELASQWTGWGYTSESYKKSLTLTAAIPNSIPLGVPEWCNFVRFKVATSLSLHCLGCSTAFCSILFLFCLAGKWFKFKSEETWTEQGPRKQSVRRTSESRSYTRCWKCECMRWLEATLAVGNVNACVG